MKQLTEKSLNEFLHWVMLIQIDRPGSFNDEANAALGTILSGPFVAQFNQIFTLSSRFILTHGLNTALFSCWCIGFMMGREMAAREQEMEALESMTETNK